MPLKNIKDFWVKVINDLKMNKGVAPSLLFEGTNWENKLRAKPTWQETETYAMNICRDIYIKAVINKANFPTGGLNPFLNELGSSAVNQYWTNVWDTVYAYQDLASVLSNKIGVDPEDNTLATDDAGNNIMVDGATIPKWKYQIRKKIPGRIKLTDIPTGLDLVDLIYQNDLYREITSLNSGRLKDIIERGLIDPNKVHKYGFDWGYKVNTTRIQEYKNAETNLTRVEDNIKIVLELNQTDPLPTGWELLLAKGYDLLDANATIATLTTERDGYKAERDNYKTKSDKYDRIHTKLKGKVSDSELDSLLNTPPPNALIRIMTLLRMNETN